MPSNILILSSMFILVPTADFPYRSEGWEFLLAGGGVFSHLDFSFTVKSPAGRADVAGVPAPYQGGEPGGGGPAIRRQIRVLKEFVESYDFVRMRPAMQDVRGRGVAGALAEPGKAYAVYVKGGPRTEVEVADLAAGTYRAEWIDPRTGAVMGPGVIEHAGGRKALSSPEYSEDLALRLVRAETTHRK